MPRRAAKCTYGFGLQRIAAEGGGRRGFCDGRLVPSAGHKTLGAGGWWGLSVTGRRALGTGGWWGLSVTGRRALGTGGWWGLSVAYGRVPGAGLQQMPEFGR